MTSRAGRVAAPPAASLPQEPLGPLLATAAVGAALGATSALAGLVAVSPDYLRYGLAAALAIMLVALGMISPVHLLCGAAAWLAVAASVRRLLEDVAPVDGPDPLLLVGPAALAALVVVAWSRGAFRERTLLANAVLVLNVLAIVCVVNPLQGGLSTGAAGLLFVLVPTFAFWIGRALGDSAVRPVLLLVALLAVPAVAYGLFQASSGFPWWDASWIETSGYTALYVDGVVKPFSSFSAAAEYSAFLGCALAIWFAVGLSRRRLLWTIPLVCVLATGIWLVGSRTLVVTTLAAIALILAAHRGWRLGTALIAVLVVALSLPTAVSVLAPEPSGNETSATLADHQLSGISNPFDPDESTLIIHTTLVVDGVRSALVAPVGQGTGAATIATTKFGRESRDTEADPGNAAVSFGIPGLVVFLIILIAGFRTVYRQASRTRDAWALAALGILTVTFSRWLNGGQYAVAFLPWLVMGWADRSEMTGSGTDPRTRAGPAEEAP